MAFSGQMKQEHSQGSVLLCRFCYKKPTIPFYVDVGVFGLHYGVTQRREGPVAVFAVEQTMFAIEHSVHLYHLVTEAAKMTEFLCRALPGPSCPALTNNVVTGVRMQYPTRSRARYSVRFLLWGAFRTFRSFFNYWIRDDVHCSSTAPGRNPAIDQKTCRQCCCLS